MSFAIGNITENKCSEANQTYQRVTKYEHTFVYIVNSHTFHIFTINLQWKYHATKPFKSLKWRATFS